MTLASLQWIARLAGSLLFLFFAVFVVADGPPPFLTMTARENFYALALFSLFTGLAVAWSWPLSGGGLTVLGWLLLAALARRQPLDWPLSAPAAVGLVNLFVGWRLRSRPAPPRPKWVAIATLGPLPLFLLIAGNEILGDPPLFAGFPEPVAVIAGEWIAQSPQAQLLIAPDGSVTGRIDGIEINGGRLRPNRSPFGRLVDWRTDYLVRGVGISIPLNHSGGTLRGSFSRQNGSGRPLVLLRKQGV
ncbi:MAG: hypothetical protein FJW30_00540 [Acidobacteria bacterium]|nr:hypothetical protein [Acidobacteriota bacterium]